MFLFAHAVPELTQCLNQLCSSSCKPPDRAMARNFLGEHRVPKPRFDTFAAKFQGTAPGVDRVREAVEDYQKRMVRVKAGPDAKAAYESHENSENLVTLGPDKDLCTVLDLTNIGFIYQEAKNSGVTAFARFEEATSKDDGEQVNAFLKARLEDAGGPAGFLESVFEAMAWYRCNVGPLIRPTWAAEWNSTAPYLQSGDPARWLEAVGVPKDYAVWIAVVRYRPKVAVYRPTQLDAGWYAHHFPSPPRANLSDGGFAMYLRSIDAAATTGLVSEYIHRQVDFTLPDWNRAGGLVGFVEKPNRGESLAQLRDQHLGILKREYGDDPDWLMAAQ